MPDTPEDVNVDGEDNNEEGQCGEPHAFRRLYDVVGGPVTVETTVSVQMLSLSNGNAIEIWTVPRCTTCQNYAIFGDIPTDIQKQLVYRSKRSELMAEEGFKFRRLSYAHRDIITEKRPTKNPIDVN
ncbi:hypothetical protein EDD86DRAFT_249415 [Gorgonomyces haynaldii]|nr:hypothetical protein EDD86DRAFT_249415 [Gorgonomyces haynaldii]